MYSYFYSKQAVFLDFQQRFILELIKIVTLLFRTFIKSLSRD
jgi:hypothetical protein